MALAQKEFENGLFREPFYSDHRSCSTKMPWNYFYFPLTVSRSEIYDTLMEYIDFNICLRML